MTRGSDILVIGAGIVGCAIASELARRGAAVSLLDARSPGDGATQASGGMLAPYTEAAEGGPLLALCARGLGLFDAFVQDVEQTSGLKTGYERGGTLHVARDGATLPHLDAMHQTLTAMGVASDRLGAGSTRRQEPNLGADIRGGLLLPTEGWLSAPAFTAALRSAAGIRGTVLLERATAQRIAASGDGVVVHTDQGELHARQVVLANGAWAGTVVVEGADAIPVKPVRGQLLHLGWRGIQLSRITWDERCYLVPWRDGTLLVGATVEDAGFEERTTVDGVRMLLDAVTALVPEARNATLLSARSGLRPGTPDGLPVIGWSTAVPGLMYATGHYRNGVLLSPLTAQLVANALLDGAVDPDLELTRPGRFGTL